MQLPRRIEHRRLGDGAQLAALKIERCAAEGPAIPMRHHPEVGRRVQLPHVLPQLAIIVAIDLATHLFPEIDELILKVNPVVIGRGIPLFRGEVRPTAVEVIERKSYDNGFRMESYRLKH